MKQAAITLLSGPVGAGKSTLADQLQDQYDVVMGADIGSPQGGEYVMPPRDQRDAIREAKMLEAMQAHEAGQNVLFEGYPRGLMKYPDLLEAADKMMYLDVPADVRQARIRQRSLDRGTDPEEDQVQFHIEEERLQRGLDALRAALGETEVEMRPYEAGYDEVLKTAGLKNAARRSTKLLRQAMKQDPSGVDASALAHRMYARGAQPRPFIQELGAGVEGVADLVTTPEGLRVEKLHDLHSPWVTPERLSQKADYLTQMQDAPGSPLAKFYGAHNVTSPDGTEVPVFNTCETPIRPNAR
jgi:predicted kinase